MLARRLRVARTVSALLLRQSRLCVANNVQLPACTVDRDPYDAQQALSLQPGDKQLRRWYAKAKEKGKPAAVPTNEPEAEVEFDMAETQRRMDKVLEHLEKVLSNIRTGRASSGMLDRVQVEAYDTHMPLVAMATITLRTPQLLVVAPFNRLTMPAVEKAIRESPLQLTPTTEGGELLVPVPKPTEELLQGMVKLVRKEAEAAKTSVRHARKAALDEVKALIVAKDERQRTERQIQKLTDDYVRRLDDMIQAKQSQFSAV